MSAIVTALDTEPVTAEHEDVRLWTPAIHGIRLTTGRSGERGVMEQRLAEAQATIAEQQERIAYLESLTMTDELTGLLNRRGFYNHFRREIAASRRHGSAGGVLMMIDLDGFKAINDTHGHLAGDAYLRRVARLIAASVRTEDVVARLGGDEFAVLLTSIDPENGTARAGQLRAFATSHHVSWNGVDLPIRFSIGVQPYGPSDSEDDVLRKADIQMYSNKGKRRSTSPRRRVPGTAAGTAAES